MPELCLPCIPILLQVPTRSWGWLWPGICYRAEARSLKNPSICYSWACFPPQLSPWDWRGGSPSGNSLPALCTAGWHSCTPCLAELLSPGWHCAARNHSCECKPLSPNPSPGLLATCSPWKKETPELLLSSVKSGLKWEPLAEVWPEPMGSLKSLFWRN